MRPLRSWELSQIRKHPRVEFIGPAQVVCGESIVRARSRNISLGGMLLESDLDCAVGTALRVCFQLPSGKPMNPHARVVHCRPGIQVGVQFMSLEDYEYGALRDFIQVDGASQRRSIRVPERLYVRLRWSKPGRIEDVPAETLLLAQHGCMIITRAAPQSDELLTLWWPERGVGTEARVIWRRKETGEWLSVALEFTQEANFWGIEFGKDN